MMTVRRNAAALVLGLTLTGGGLGAAGVLAGPAPASVPLAVAAQATPAAPGGAGAPCTPGATGGGSADVTDTDQVEDQQDGDTANDEADASAEGDAEDQGAGGAADQQDGANEGDGADQQDGAEAQPGTLDRGQELLPKAAITVEQAVAAAQGAAQGALGSVDLVDRNGVLVFEVNVGDQEVGVNAADGTVADVQTDAEDGCDTEANVAPGTLDRGQELLPKAAITLEQAVATAQGAASGTLGEVDLEQYNGTLVFTVAVGAQDVHVNAATGSVVDITSGEG